MIMFAEIVSTEDAVIRIAVVMFAVFAIAVAFAWLTRKR